MKVKRLALSVAIGVVVLMAALLALNVMAPVAAAPLATRSALTATQITTSGITETLAAANADGNKFYNNGKRFIEVYNGYTATITATFVTPGTFMGLAIADKTVAVAASTTKYVGPFPGPLYNQLSGSDKGMVYVNYTGVTSVTVAVWELP